MSIDSPDDVLPPPDFDGLQRLADSENDAAAAGFLPLRLRHVSLSPAQFTAQIARSEQLLAEIRANQAPIFCGAQRSTVAA